MAEQSPVRKSLRNHALPTLSKKVPPLKVSPSIVQLSLNKQKSTTNLHSKQSTPVLQPNVSLNSLRKPKLIDLSGLLSSRLQQAAQKSVPRLAHRLQFPGKHLLKDRSNSSRFRQAKSTPRLLKVDVTPQRTPLTDFEKQEVLSFKHTYYLGEKALNVKKRLGHRFWEERTGEGDNSYRCIPGDHIAYRYEVLRQIGEGAFGVVFEVLDHKRKQHCALKILKRVPDHLRGVESDLLKKIKAQDLFHKSHIVRILHSFQFRKYSCFTTELLGNTLLQVLAAQDYAGLKLEHIQVMAAQLLHALTHLAAASAIHCDVKPENVLIQSWEPLTVKLIDFGSACYEHKKVYNYIQSRFYRAPEIMLDIEYSKAIDMWSLGCVLAELYTGAPLFPGHSETEQFQLVVELLGEPPASMFLRARNKSLFLDFEGNKLYPAELAGSKQLETVLADADLQFVELVRGKNYTGCLHWDPAKRLTPEAALEMPWLASSS